MISRQRSIGPLALAALALAACTAPKKAEPETTYVQSTTWTDRDGQVHHDERALSPEEAEKAKGMQPTITVKKPR